MYSGHKSAEAKEYLGAGMPHAKVEARGGGGGCGSSRGCCSKYGGFCWGIYYELRAPPQVPPVGITEANLGQGGGQIGSQIYRIDGDAQRTNSKINALLVYFGALRDEVSSGAATTTHMEVYMQHIVETLTDRSPAAGDGGDARERHVQQPSWRTTRLFGKAFTCGSIGFCDITRPLALEIRLLICSVS